MSHSNTNVLLSALSHVASFAGSRLQAEHGKTRLQALEAQLAHEVRRQELDAKVKSEQMILEGHRLDLQAGIVREVIQAVIAKRVDVLQGAFNEIARGYAEQARHYMTQQDRVADAQMAITDPIQRADCQARLVAIDSQLHDIRRSWHRLFREMSKTLLLLGSSSSLDGLLTASDMRCLNG